MAFFDFGGGFPFGGGRGFPGKSSYTSFLEWKT